ncbi:helix-turn-helix domain-containing protein [Arcticibacter sp. MXS-1]|uniref:IS66 family insertion sequence element accessory protein TnpA n=1 Tax=Arcticibacter sp. MXS-1 TaxID=3341726 RepID=UPI0035A98001
MDQRERMKAEVARWRESGLTQKEFSRQLGMKVATFAYWVSRSKESEKKKGFLPLVPVAGSVEAVEVSYPNGVRIKVPASDLKTISQLIHLY